MIDSYFTADVNNHGNIPDGQVVEGNDATEDTSLHGGQNGVQVRDENGQHMEEEERGRGGKMEEGDEDERGREKERKKLNAREQLEKRTGITKKKMDDDEEDDLLNHWHRFVFRR